MNIPHYVSDLIENLNIGVFFLDKDMNIFFSNQAFLNMCELEREEVARIRPHIQDIFPEIDEDLFIKKGDILTDKGILKILAPYEDTPFYGIGILNPYGPYYAIKSELPRVRRGLIQMAVILITLETEDKICEEEKYKYLNFLKENLRFILRDTDIVDQISFVKYGEGEILILLFMKEKSFDGLRTVVDRIKGVADKEEGCIKGISIGATFATQNDNINTLMDRVSKLLSEARPNGSIIDVEE